MVMDQRQDQEYPLFAGRIGLLNRVHQFIGSPKAHAFTIIGRPQIGKTRILQHLIETHPETIFYVYIALRLDDLAKVDDISMLLIDKIDVELTNFFPVRGDVWEIPPQMASRRQWFTDAFLPEVLKTLRRRRMVILLDDLHIIGQAITDSLLPEDSIEFVANSLLDVTEIICTISLDYEDQLTDFAPLINTDELHRVDALTLEDISDLLRRTIQTPITDDAITEFFQISGGEPVLVQLGVEHIPVYHNLPYTPEQVGQIFTALYPEALRYLHMRWDRLTEEEKIILQAMAACFIEDPTRPIQTNLIEKWLVETDTPLDDTTISTAVRSLEYQEYIAGAATDLQFKSRLMRRWVIEHGEATNKTLKPDNDLERSEKPIPWGVVFIGTLILIIVILVAGTVLDRPDNSEPVPTITLEPGQ